MKFSKKAFLPLFAALFVFIFIGIGIAQRKGEASVQKAKEEEHISKEAEDLSGHKSPTSFESADSDTIEELPDTAEATEEDEPSSTLGKKLKTEMFAEKSLDNTWLFGGGVETQGRFAEIGGIRNYIGQFEEYIRWVKRIDDELYGMQRYTINAGKEGQDAKEFSDRLTDLIEKTKPKAVSYLIGPEDYAKGSSGIAEFRAALSNIIETSLHMQNDTGFVVVQLPHAVGKEQSSNVRLYTDSAKEIVEETASGTDCADRILLVDHFSQTDNSTFQTTMLMGDGYLNASGHYEMAKQFAQAVYGTSEGFPVISGSWTMAAAPNTYLNILPTAKASSDSLSVSVSDYSGAADFRYVLKIDGVEISGTASGNPFTIDRLPFGKDYELLLMTADGSVQFAQAAGTIEPSDISKASLSEQPLQQEIRKKASGTEALTWLFMGDSITHAAAHTKGYDGIAQLFEKYLKEDLGRTDDLVINTSVSGATAERTLEHIRQRMTKYQPDIVSIMLGTNDAMYPEIFAGYQMNLKNIVKEIRAVRPDALIIFRSPVPASGEYAEDAAGEDGSVARMRKTAEADGNILFIDQYSDWNIQTSAYSYLFDAAHDFGDGGLHPGAAGHVRMTTQFIRECGLNTNTKIANLSYVFQYIRTESKVTPSVRFSSDNDTITIDKRTLQAAYGTKETLGSLTAVLTDKAGRSYQKEEGPNQNQIQITDLPLGVYTLEVSAKIKGNTAKIVTFARQEIDLKTGEAIRSYEEESSENELTPEPDSDSQSKKTPEISEDGTFENNTFLFKVISQSERTAEIVGLKNKNLKKVTIPDTVTVEKKQYRIVSIAASAFFNNKKMTNAVIGRNVVKIGKQAFGGCSQLKQIKIQSSVLQKVGKRAFADMDKQAAVFVPKAKYQEYKRLLLASGFKYKVKKMNMGTSKN